MKRRIKALLLAVLMVVSVLVVDVPHVHAETTYGISVDKQEVHPGDTFTLTITVPSTEVLCAAMSLVVEFDPMVVQLQSISAPELDDMEDFDHNTVEKANANGKLKIYALTVDEADGFSLENGYVATAEFTVLATQRTEHTFTLDEWIVCDINDVELFEQPESELTINVTIPATNISIKADGSEVSELTLKEEAAATLTATVTPATSTDTVVWSSSDESVATVENGVVTAVAAGEATITAAAGSVSDTCTVTVTCAHKSLTSNEQVNATCTTDGKKAYDQCTCGAYLIDGEEVSEADLVINKLGHEFITRVEENSATCTDDGTKAYYKCTRCAAISLDGASECTKENLVITAQGHQYGEQVADDHLVSAATCTKSAVYNKSCIVCGEEHESETFEAGEPLGHTLIKTDAKAATCTEDGNIEYWYCSRCDKYFRDAEATDETVKNGTVISATGHDKAEDTEYSSDDTQHWKECACGNFIVAKEDHDLEDKTDATYHWKECSVCDKTVNKEEHVYNQEVATDTYLKSAATCKNAAVYYKSCSCGYVSTTDTFETQALGHDFTGEEIPAIAPTCTEDGQYAYYKCQRENCGAVSKDGTTVCTEADLVHDKLGHDLVKTEAKAATCTEVGNKAYWTCRRTECQKHYSEEEAVNEITDLSTTVISATGHSNVDTTAWTTDGDNHWKVCTNTGCDEVIAAVESHNLEMKYDETDHWKECATCDYTTEKDEHVGGSATCLEKATCTECSAEYDDLGAHNWVENPETAYLKSAAACEAKAVYYKSCSVCEQAHTETFENGEALGHDYELQDEVPQTCEETGTKEHYACIRCDAVSFDKEEKCAASDLVIPADGHDTEYTSAVAPTCTTSGNYAYWQCQTEDCGKYFDEEAATTVLTWDEDIYLEALGHTASNSWSKDESNHWKECVRCGLANITDKDSHDFAMKSNETHHWEECTVCGYTAAEEQHAGGTATCIKLAECDTCSKEYGLFAACVYANVVDSDYVITEATCEAKGEYYKSCTVCGEAHETETFEVDALGHAYELQAEVPATCEGEGTKEHYACTRCDAVSFDKEEKCAVSDLVIEATGHEYDEVVAEEYLVSEATCIAKAVYKVSCTTCGEVHATETFETGDVNADNHAGETEVRDAKEAKCYEYGYTGDTYCLDCGVLVEEGEQIDKLAHNITTWEVVKEPTTTEEGLKVGYCENKSEGCTEEQYVTLAKLVAVGEEIQVETDGEVTVESVIVSSESNVNEDVILQIEDVTDELSEAELAAVESAAQQLEAVDDEAEVLTIFDIHLLIREMSESGEIISESEFDLEGSVELKIQLSEEFVNNYENIVLIHVKDDGSIEVIPYTIDENNVVTFTATDFSYYAFVGTEKESEDVKVDTDNNKENPDTGDSAPILLWAAVAILAMGTVFVSKTRRQR